MTFLDGSKFLSLLGLVCILCKIKYAYYRSVEKSWNNNERNQTADVRSQRWVTSFLSLKTITYALLVLFSITNLCVIMFCCIYSSYRQVLLNVYCIIESWCIRVKLPFFWRLAYEVLLMIHSRWVPCEGFWIIMHTIELDSGFQNKYHA